MWLTHKSKLIDNYNYPARTCVEDPEYVWVDGAVIVIKALKNNQTFVLHTKEMVIPLNYDKPGENGNWSRLKDPHLDCVGISRSVFLAEAMIRWRNKEEAILAQSDSALSWSGLFLFASANKHVALFVLFSVMVVLKR